MELSKTASCTRLIEWAFIRILALLERENPIYIKRLPLNKNKGSFMYLECVILLFFYKLPNLRLSFDFAFCVILNTWLYNYKPPDCITQV